MTPRPTDCEPKPECLQGKKKNADGKCVCPPATVINPDADKCMPCRAGTFAVQDGGDGQCVPCGGGHSSPQGSTSIAACTKCPKGTVSSGGTPCFKCPSGQVPGPDQQHCVPGNACAANPCPAGEVCVPQGFGNRKCTCPPTATRNPQTMKCATTVSSCKQSDGCTVKTKINWDAAKAVCTARGEHLCTVGQLCGSADGSPIGGWRLGEYPEPFIPVAEANMWVAANAPSDTGTQAVCKRQSTAYARDNVNVVCCKTLACPEGQELHQGKCRDCPSGKYCTGGVAKTCAPGRYPVGDHCAPCPPGWYCPRGVRLQCPAGRFASTAGSVTTCPGKCPNNTFSTEIGQKDASSCKPCPKGTFARKGWKQCLRFHPCKSGLHYCSKYAKCVPDGNAALEYCSVPGCLEGIDGTDVSLNHHYTCRCFPGYEDVGGWGLVPTKWDPTPRKQHMMGKECMLACHPSEFRNASKGCECPAGTYLRDGTLPCSDCPAGTTSAPGSTSINQCTKCPAGTFKADEGRGSCTTCPKASHGYWMPRVGATQCVPNPCMVNENVCGKHSRCTPSIHGGNFTCSCLPGFTGTNGRNCTKQCKRRPECLEKGGCASCEATGWKPWVGYNTYCTLCTYKQLCGNGTNTIPPGRARQGMNWWVAIRDGNNQWVNFGDNGLCERAVDPKWGTPSFHAHLLRLGSGAEFKKLIRESNRGDHYCCKPSTMCDAGLGKCPKNSHCKPGRLYTQAYLDDYTCECDEGHAAEPHDPATGPLDRRNPRCKPIPPVEHPNCLEKNGCHTVSEGRGYLSFEDSKKMCDARGETLCSQEDVCDATRVPLGGVRTGKFAQMMMPVYATSKEHDHGTYGKVYGMQYVHVGDANPNKTCTTPSTGVPHWFTKSLPKSWKAPDSERGEIQCCPKCAGRNMCYLTNGNMTWDYAQRACLARDRELCSARAVCSHAGKPIGGARKGSMWVPTRDARNTWVQIGDVEGMCEPFSSKDAAGADGVGPSWGNQHMARTDRGELQCCPPRRRACLASKNCFAEEKRPAWRKAVKLCRALGKDLCSQEQLCPRDNPLLGGLRHDDMWIPVRDAKNTKSENEWVYVGRDTTRACKSHSTIYGAKPNWGLSDSTDGSQGEVQCCDACIGPSCTKPTKKPLTHADARAMCQAKGQKLCTRKQMCNRRLGPIGGLRSFPAVVPVVESDTETGERWMRVGTGADSLCGTYDTPTEGAERELQCCGVADDHCPANDRDCMVHHDTKFTWSDARALCDADDKRLVDRGEVCRGNKVIAPGGAVQGKNMWLPITGSGKNMWLQIGDPDGTGEKTCKTWGELHNTNYGTPQWGRESGPADRKYIRCSQNKRCGSAEKCAELRIGRLKRRRRSVRTRACVCLTPLKYAIMERPSRLPTSTLMTIVSLSARSTATQKLTRRITASNR